MSLITEHNNVLQEYLQENNLTNYQWLVLPVGNNKYYINEYGSIISIYHKKPTILKPFLCNGYLTVRINKKNYKVHRLVCMMFNDNPNNENICHHRDHQKNNNYYKNLVWTTQQENVKEYHKFKRQEAEKRLKETANKN